MSDGKFCAFHCSGECCQWTVPLPQWPPTHGEQFRSPGQEYPTLPRKIISPLSERLHEWRTLLQGHPNEGIKRFILNGLERGFRIGHGRESQLVSSTNNLLLCLEHPDMVQAYTEKVFSGKDARHLSPVINIKPSFMSALFGVIPKKTTDKWCLIVDLSASHGASINDRISQESLSLSYETVDIIVEKVASLGRGTMFAKLDIKSAFRIIPVTGCFSVCIGMATGTQTQSCLSGSGQCRNYSMPLLTLFKYVARSQGVRYIGHYLDNYIILGELQMRQ